jgi:hypothetical protein
VNVFKRLARPVAGAVHANDCRTGGALVSRMSA